MPIHQEPKMPLQNTLDLLSQYGQKLIDNSITDDELKQFMDNDNFKAQTNSEIYPKTSYSDADYQSLHAMLDFVESIAPFLEQGVLPALVTRCLMFEKVRRDSIKDKIRENPQNFNGYMRDTVLEKYLLTYELAQTEPAGKKSTRFDKNGVLYDIYNTTDNDDATEKALNSLQGILSPSIRFYQKKQGPADVLHYHTGFDYPHGQGDWSAKLAIHISMLPNEDYKSHARTFLKTAHELIISDKENATIAKEAIEKTVALMKGEMTPKQYATYVTDMQTKNYSQTVQTLGALMLGLAKFALAIVKIATLGQAKQTISKLEFNIDKYRHRFLTGRDKDLSDDMEAVSKAEQNNRSPSST